MACLPCEAAAAKQARIRGLGEALVRGLGEAPSGAPAALPDAGRHALALGGVAAGGALIGALIGAAFGAAGRGATLGALVHLALFTVGGAAFGGLSRGTRLVYGGIGAATTLGTGYALLRRSR